MTDPDDFRPRKVVALLVGAATPADGPSFYGADSNLFRATRAAFAIALCDAVPDGQAFLKFFATRGWWQVNVAESNLAELLPETKPKQIVVIKADIARAVQRAVEEATMRKPPTITVLRYPIRQWRAEYVTKLAALVAGA